MQEQWEYQYVHTLQMDWDMYSEARRSIPAMTKITTINTTNPHVPDQVLCRRWRLLMSRFKYIEVGIHTEICSHDGGRKEEARQDPEQQHEHGACDGEQRPQYLVQYGPRGPTLLRQEAFHQDYANLERWHGNCNVKVRGAQHGNSNVKVRDNM